MDKLTACLLLSHLSADANATGHLRHVLYVARSSITQNAVVLCLIVVSTAKAKCGFGLVMRNYRGQSYSYMLHKRRPRQGGDFFVEICFAKNMFLPYLRQIF